MSINLNRFDYIKYDEKAVNDQKAFKLYFQSLEFSVDELLKSPRAKALVYTKLEEAYMWVGKAIRDDQISRNENGTFLQEDRSNE